MITKIGKEKLEEKLQKLNDEVKEVGHKRGLAAADGDLKENSAYIFLTEKGRFIHSQIDEILADLKTAVIQDPPTHTDFICFGHQVSLVYENDKNEKTITLVGKNDAHLFPDWISFETPIGQALMGKKVGEIVMVNGQPVRILSITIGKI
jgi:transcription elongation factor GreA